MFWMGMVERRGMSASLDEFDAVLRDGRTVHLRAAGPADEAAYLRAFDKLSPDARYMRFMRVVREPNRNALRKVLASFPESGCGIVATVPAEDGFEIVGSAICMAAKGANTGEFAMTVASDYAGAGLGRILLSGVIEAAKRRGLRELTGFVLAANLPMLRLAGQLGFAIAPDPDDAAACICRLSFDGR